MSVESTPFLIYALKLKAETTSSAYFPLLRSFLLKHHLCSEDERSKQIAKAISESEEDEDALLSFAG